MLFNNNITSKNNNCILWYLLWVTRVVDYVIPRHMLFSLFPDSGQGSSSVPGLGFMGRASFSHCSGPPRDTPLLESLLWSRKSGRTCSGVCYFLGLLPSQVTLFLNVSCLRAPNSTTEISAVSNEAWGYDQRLGLVQMLLFQLLRLLP